MEVFLSWSGPKSRQLAQVFRSWLPKVIQSIRPFFSNDDIGKGLKWQDKISEKLEKCNVGIFLITSDNINSPWLIFEAGAMSARKKVCTIFFDHHFSKISGPLAQFQGSNFNHDDILKILLAINESLDSEKINENLLIETFERRWPELDTDVQCILECKEPWPISPIENAIETKITWEYLMNAISRMDQYFSEQNFSFDYIVSFSDGGLIVSDLLHIIFRSDVPVVSIIIERFEPHANRISQFIEISYPNEESNIFEGKSLLLIDDVINTGNSLIAVREHLEKKFNANKIIMAVIGKAEHSPVKLDYFDFKYEGKCSLPYGDVPRKLPLGKKTE